jgi:acyl dehydratase
MPSITLEELQNKVGQRIGSSRWFTIDQPRIDAFADLTEDHQYIHIDPKRAAQTDLGSTIAHGFLTVSLLSAMYYDAMPKLEGAEMGLNYGFNKLRFLSPVHVDARIRGHFDLLHLRHTGQKVTETMQVSVEIEGSDRPALVAEWVNLYMLERDHK